MDLNRLFRVLVVGGSVLGCADSGRSKALSADDAGGGGAGGEVQADSGGGDQASPESDAVAEVADAAPDVSAVDAASSDAPAREVASQPCFCNTTPSCCQAHPGGPATVVEGFECCWGTSC